MLQYSSGQSTVPRLEKSYGFAPKTGEPFLVLGELIGKDLDSHVPFELAVPGPSNAFRFTWLELETGS